MSDVAGGVLRELDRVSGSDLADVLAVVGGMLREDERGEEFEMVGWMLEDCAEALSEEDAWDESEFESATEPDKGELT